MSSPGKRGILVDQNMRSISDKNIYAAGDCCTVYNWPAEETPNWFQMRLWTQAIQMGKYAARCVVSDLAGEENEMLDFCFTTFTHVTSFFGYRTALLGLYNAQSLPTRRVEIIFRETKGDEFIKVVIFEDRVRGAILIYKDDCELLEVIENLISNEINIGELKDGLLDPEIDIADYFD